MWKITFLAEVLTDKIQFLSLALHWFGTKTIIRLSVGEYW